jgi:hypothetical protein
VRIDHETTRRHIISIMAEIRKGRDEIDKLGLKGLRPEGVSSPPAGNSAKESSRPAGKFPAGREQEFPAGGEVSPSTEFCPEFALVTGHVGQSCGPCAHDI